MVDERVGCHCLGQLNVSGEGLTFKIFQALFHLYPYNGIIIYFQRASELSTDEGDPLSETRFHENPPPPSPPRGFFSSGTRHILLNKNATWFTLFCAVPRFSLLLYRWTWLSFWIPSKTSDVAGAEFFFLSFIRIIMQTVQKASELRTIRKPNFLHKWVSFVNKEISTWNLKKIILWYLMQIL